MFTIRISSALTCLLVASASHAANFSGSVSALASAEVQYAGGDHPLPVQSTFSSISANTTQSGNQASMGIAGSGSLGISVSQPGQLRASAQAQSSAQPGGVGLSQYGSGGNASALVDVSLSDSFVLQSASVAAGTSATIVVDFDVLGLASGDGVIAGTPSSEAKSQWLSFVALDGTRWSGGQYFDNADTRQTPLSLDYAVDGHPSLGHHSLTLPVVFGTPVNMAMNLNLTAYSASGASCSPVPGGLLCTNNAVMTSALYTLVWGGISSALDAQGRPIANFTALSPDTQFDYALAAVPEPGSVSLLFAGFVLIATLRRSRA